MSELDAATEVQRHFPTVILGETDVALAEYQAASARCQADERAITIANGLLIGGLAAVLPVAAPLLRDLFENGVLQQGTDLVFIAFLVSWAFITAVISSYVCDLRKAYVFAARKVIVIRRLLGQSYGKFNLVLPSWRLEGADNPFTIKLFPGWKMAESYSLYATVFLSAVVTWVAGLYALPDVTFVDGDARFLSTVLSTLWGAYWLLSIRRKLYDTHENGALTFAKVLARLLGVRLVGNIHYILYRAQLSRSEGHRLSLEFDIIKPILIFREDRSFLSHRGFALRSIGRAAWDWLRGRPSGGASTITQQVARSLFIVNLRRRLQRKLVEIALAVWLERILDKQELLEVYITSVRYDRNVSGFISARKHFFGDAERALTKAEALVLIERVSNVLGLFRGGSVRQMLADAIAQKIIAPADAAEALKIYETLINAGKIRGDDKTSPQVIAKALGLS